MGKDKRCSKCGRLKPSTEFGSNGLSKTTGQKLLRSSCRACEKVRDSKRYMPKPAPKAADLKSTLSRLALEFRQWEKSQNPWEGRYEVDLKTDCWVWSGACDKAGYPIRADGRWSSVNCHRQIMEDLGHGLTGKHVHHECRNTSCINPSHLKVMTPEAHMAEHAREAVDKRVVISERIKSYVASLTREELSVVGANGYIAKRPKALRVPAIAKALQETEWLIRSTLKVFPL